MNQDFIKVKSKKSKVKSTTQKVKVKLFTFILWIYLLTFEILLFVLMSKEKNSQEEKKKSCLRLEVLEKISTLATVGLGLVAAKAWNSAIQALFKQIFGEQSNLAAMFGYAGFITVIVVVVTVYLSRTTNKIKENLKDQEASFLDNFKALKNKAKDLF